MAKDEVAVCTYIPPQLLKVMNDEVYKKGISRSSFIKSLLLDHFSKGNDEERVRLLGRDKGKK
jgi:hypothetical protein